MENFISRYSKGSPLLLSATPYLWRTGAQPHVRGKSHATTQGKSAAYRGGASRGASAPGRGCIENLTWQRLLKNYDKESTFFYLDPPYHQVPYDNHNMKLVDYQQLAEILNKIKGKFILSINDHPDMRMVFKKFKIKPVSVAYTANNKKRSEGKKLLISNL